MKKKEKSKYLWYTRNSSGVKGPFTIGMVQRFVLIGRLKQDDEVSLDKQIWSLVKEVAEIIPEEMRHLETDEDQQRLLIAQLREDERSRDRRATQAESIQGRRSNKDRRQIEDFNTRIHREIKNKTTDLYHARQHQLLPTMISVLLFVGLFVLGFFIYTEATRQVIQSSDCNSLPSAGVNWNHCQMEGVILENMDLKGAQFNNTNLMAANLAHANLMDADMAYANLELAVLKNAELVGVTLKGASLRHADLSYASLKNADLSYVDLRRANVTGADFSQANMYKAIWVDGRQCMSDKPDGCAELFKTP